jgi:hypothetical protein
MRGAWVAIVVAGIAVLGGCTAILGLENVSSVDRDNDNVPDAVDNCPDDSNPDQSDFDRNGKGDACDLCTDGGADDVDNDGIPDGCDGCIGTGMDVDNDRIDDGCDACIGSGVDADDDNIDDACDACIGNGLDADHDVHGHRQRHDRRRLRCMRRVAGKHRRRRRWHREHVRPVPDRPAAR